MGSALIRGLIASGKIAAGAISVFEVDESRARSLEIELEIRRLSAVEEVVGPDTRMLVLAVKPQQLGEVLDSVAGRIHDRLVVVSIAAGVPASFISSRIGFGARIIRAMPNAAAMIGKSATAVCRAAAADEADLLLALDLFSAIGDAVAVDEKMMNAVTALSGSGPGYLFVIMEALTDAGVGVGLDRTTSRRLAVQTVAGAAAMAADGNTAFSDLKDRITSPGGTTSAGLHVMERAGLRGILMDAVRAATKRGEELAPRD